MRRRSFTVEPHAGETLLQESRGAIRGATFAGATSPQSTVDPSGISTWSRRTSVAQIPRRWHSPRSDRAKPPGLCVEMNLGRRQVGCTSILVQIRLHSALQCTLGNNSSRVPEDRGLRLRPWRALAHYLSYVKCAPCCSQHCSQLHLWAIPMTLGAVYR